MYDMSSDGNYVVFAARDPKGEAGLWLARLDGSLPPRRVPGIEGDWAVFGRPGENILSIQRWFRFSSAGGWDRAHKSDSQTRLAGLPTTKGRSTKPQRGPGLAFGRTLKNVHSFLRHLLSSEQAAEDIMQDTFTCIWHRPQSFKPEHGNLRRYLFGISRKLAAEYEVYAKEAALIADIREELRQGRRCQVYATYTGEKDVNGRLEWILSAAGFRVAVLRASVPTHKREEWYDRQLESGVEVVICHPKLVETGPRSARISDPPLLSNRLFATHASSGKPALLAHRTKAFRAGEVPDVQSNDAGDLPPADGAENARGAHDGRKVLRRRPAVA